MADAAADEFDKDIPTKQMIAHVPLNERNSNEVVAIVGERKTIPLSGEVEFRMASSGLRSC